MKPKSQSLRHRKSCSYSIAHEGSISWSSLSCPSLSRPSANILQFQKAKKCLGGGSGTLVKPNQSLSLCWIMWATKMILEFCVVVCDALIICPTRLPYIHLVGIKLGHHLIRSRKTKITGIGSALMCCKACRIFGSGMWIFKRGV